MKKRTKVPKANNAIFDEPLSVVSRPPGSPPNYVPPTPAEIFARLQGHNENEIIPSTNSTTEIIPNQVEPVDPAPDSKTLDILARLKAISNGETMPVPTEMPKINVLPKIGVEFDSMSHIEAPKADNPLAALEELQENEESEDEPINNPIDFLQYDKPLGFGIARAYRYAATHGLIYKHKGDDEQILEYRDGEGNLIDTRTAFKLQSHIFSGRYSSIKNRLKSQIKARAFNNKDNFEVGDTPLHTAASLRNALAENKTAFIELTGENKRVMPYEPIRLDIDEKMKAKKEKKKKRLKMKTKKLEAKERAKEQKEMEDNLE
ncbi:hypothetical protein M9Y10_034253 [Tritrichomonas musculus]|uniref:Uncharacterized protein n=1 Tax=Tritrichomonas musculus TaxID=1915356 RepID=A0ABR2KEK6_9EUKA